MVLQFPIGETQRNEQNRLSREWCRGLVGNVPSAEIIEFPAMPRQTEPLCDLAECEFSS